MFLLFWCVILFDVSDVNWYDVVCLDKYSYRKSMRIVMRVLKYLIICGWCIWDDISYVGFWGGLLKSINLYLILKFW